MQTTANTTTLELQTTTGRLLTRPAACIARGEAPYALVRASVGDEGAGQGTCDNVEDAEPCFVVARELVEHPFPLDRLWSFKHACRAAGDPPALELCGAQPADGDFDFAAAFGRVLRDHPPTSPAALADALRRLPELAAGGRRPLLSGLVRVAAVSAAYVAETAEGPRPFFFLEAAPALGAELGPARPLQVVVRGEAGVRQRPLLHPGLVLYATRLRPAMLLAGRPHAAPALVDSPASGARPASLLLPVPARLLPEAAAACAAACGLAADALAPPPDEEPGEPSLLGVAGRLEGAEELPGAGGAVWRVAPAGGGPPTRVYLTHVPLGGLGAAFRPGARGYLCCARTTVELLAPAPPGPGLAPPAPPGARPPAGHFFDVMTGPEAAWLLEAAAALRAKFGPRLTDRRLFGDPPPPPAPAAARRAPKRRRTACGLLRHLVLAAGHEDAARCIHREFLHHASAPGPAACPAAEVRPASWLASYSVPTAAERPLRRAGRWDLPSPPLLVLAADAAGPAPAPARRLRPGPGPGSLSLHDASGAIEALWPAGAADALRGGRAVALTEFAALAELEAGEAGPEDAAPPASRLRRLTLLLPAPADPAAPAPPRSLPPRTLFLLPRSSPATAAPAVDAAAFGPPPVELLFLVQHRTGLFRRGGGERPPRLVLAGAALAEDGVPLAAPAPRLVALECTAEGAPLAALLLATATPGRVLVLRGLRPMRDPDRSRARRIAAEAGLDPADPPRPPQGRPRRCLPAPPAQRLLTGAAASFSFATLQRLGAEPAAGLSLAFPPSPAAPAPPEPCSRCDDGRPNGLDALGGTVCVALPPAALAAAAALAADASNAGAPLGLRAALDALDAMEPPEEGRPAPRLSLRAFVAEKGTRLAPPAASGDPSEPAGRPLVCYRCAEPPAGGGGGGRAHESILLYLDTRESVEPAGLAAGALVLFRRLAARPSPSGCSVLFHDSASSAEVLSPPSAASVALAARLLDPTDWHESAAEALPERRLAALYSSPPRPSRRPFLARCALPAVLSLRLRWRCARCGAEPVPDDPRCPACRATLPAAPPAPRIGAGASGATTGGVELAASARLLIDDGSAAAEAACEGPLPLLARLLAVPLPDLEAAAAAAWRGGTFAYDFGVPFARCGLIPSSPPLSSSPAARLHATLARRTALRELRLVLQCWTRGRAPRAPPTPAASSSSPPSSSAPPRGFRALPPRARPPERDQCCKIATGADHENSNF
eukprot:tig00000431_g685.t1